MPRAQAEALYVAEEQAARGRADELDRRRRGTRRVRAFAYGGLEGAIVTSHGAYCSTVAGTVFALR